MRSENQLFRNDFPLYPIQAFRDEPGTDKDDPKTGTRQIADLLNRGDGCDRSPLINRDRLWKGYHAAVRYQYAGETIAALNPARWIHRGRLPDHAVCECHSVSSGNSVTAAACNGVIVG